jgi:methylated-DNA-[protein]-cysteine S-methyltransferase
MTDLEQLLSGTPVTPGDAEAARMAARRTAERAAADGLVDVAVAEVDSPLGPLVAARTPRGLVRLAYADFEGGRDAVLEDLAARLSPRVLEVPRRLDDVARQLDEYFTGHRQDFEVPVDFALSRGFRRSVLEAINRIPYGRVASYGDLARQTGSPGASRAVGGACGSNPIPIVVPCHRVVRTGGALGGYTGGLERKRFLLSLEGVLL